MTRLEEMKLDLQTHKDRLKEIKTPNYKPKLGKITPEYLIPTYVKIIGELTAEIAELEAKKPAKKGKK